MTTFITNHSLRKETVATEQLNWKKTQNVEWFLGNSLQTCLKQRCTDQSLSLVTNWKQILAKYYKSS